MSTTLYLTTHTPVHIGTGAELEAFEVVVDHQRYYRIRLDAVFGRILDAHPEAADEYATWIDEQVRKLDGERDNKRQAEIRKGMTVLGFVQGELGDQPLLTALKQDLGRGLSRYEMASANQSTFRQKIREQLKTATQELYLPGSSLKGAFRTALLYQVLCEATDNKKQQYRGILEGCLKNRNKDKFFTQGLEQEVFVCGHRERNQTVYRDARYDLWRLVGFSDTDTRPAAQAGVVTDVDLFKMNGDIDRQAPPVEAIAPGQTFTCQVRVDTAFLLQARRLLASGADPKFGKENWIGLKDKFQRVFGFDFTTVADPAEIERRVVDRLLEASQHFRRAVLARERRWAEVQIENGKQTSRANALKRFYDGLPPEAFKVGWASGFPATTVFTALADDPVLEPVLQQIMDHFRIGVPRKAKDNRQGVNLKKLPSSRRYAVDAGKHVEAFGWVSASRTPPAAPAVAVAASAAAPAAAAPPTPPPGPGLPTWLEQVKKTSSGIPAEVVDNSRSPLKVRIWVKGYEQQTFDLGGVNRTEFPPGSLLLVKVNDWDKRTDRIHTVVFEKNPRLSVPKP